MLAALLFLTAAAAVWRPDYLPAALLRRSAPAAPAARFYSFDLVREYPHDPDAFTQVHTLPIDLIHSHGESILNKFFKSHGLFWQGLLYAGNDTLFESTGLYHRVMCIGSLLVACIIGLLITLPKNLLLQFSLAIKMHASALCCSLKIRLAICNPA
jgi:glutamine cyclotransferase